MINKRIPLFSKIKSSFSFVDQIKYYDDKENFKQNQYYKNNYGGLLLGTTVSTYILYKLWDKNKFYLPVMKAYAEAQTTPMDLYTPPERKDLPTISMENVKKHGKKSERIWGVYDVTDFYKSHPGGDKILLAAGSSVEPYWSIYAQHKAGYVMEILEELRIGSLDKAEAELAANEAKKMDANDPYIADPIRHPALLINSQKPFNAETPASLLIDNFYTPNSLFFVRNHMPVPQTELNKHELVIEGIGIKKPLKLSVDELEKNFEQVHVTSTIQCAGNRRNDMNDYKKVQGLMWTGTAISNAKWTGVRLKDVLLKSGVKLDDRSIKHVHFQGADKDDTGLLNILILLLKGVHYEASITFEKAISPEVIIAYKMNDELIPRDHGFPLRLICPGNVGARQVKWLSKITTSDIESQSHWQKKDYRGFSPAVQSGDSADYSSVPAIQEYPVQSYICAPSPHSKINKDDKTLEVFGYAWSGGGRGIIRVDVSIDGGKTWQIAELEHDKEQDLVSVFFKFQNFKGAYVGLDAMENKSEYSRRYKRI